MEKKKSTAQIVEFVIVVMLGITAVATAWSSWQGGLHGSQMDQKYTQSNNLASEGNAEYNAGVQALTRDMMIYNEINSLAIDRIFAESKGDEDEVLKLSWKIEELMDGNAGELLEASIYWAWEESERTGVTISPFENEELTDSYFETAMDLLAQSAEVMEAGNANNTHGDNQGLVSVIYAVVLFMLGISGTFKGLREKYVLLAVAGLGFLLATVFMLTIPIVLP